jgi:mRNA-degrading endonuclease RelE of RelBE toxin-antitoxin system
MNVEYKNTFLRSIKKVRETRTKLVIAGVINDCKNAHRVSDIPHCEPLTSKGKYYKIKRASLRFGVKIDNGSITFMAFGTRQSFYDNFPPS